MHRELGIDLGATTLTVSAPGEGIILKEPSYVARSRADGGLLAFGGEAWRLFEEGNEQISLTKPFRDTLCAKNVTVPLFSYLLERSSCDTEQNRILIASPCGDAEATDAALIELASQAGAQECYLVYAPIAALVGEGLNFDRAKCVLQIGSARSHVLVVGGNGIIFYRATIRTAGDAFDAAIVSYLENHYGMKISLPAAEKIKRQIGTVWTSTERLFVDVSGRHIRTGEIIKKRIWSDELLIAFEEPMTDLLEEVYRALNKLPSESIRDVLEDGIYLMGGGSRLRGMGQMICEVTRVKVKPLREEDATARGLAEILSRLPRQMQTSVGNISKNCIKMYMTARHVPVE